MLSAHLNLNWDGASRNSLAIEETANWIANQCSDGSLLLDLGCGPGLYATELSRKGFSVTGIDINPHSVEYAMRKSEADKLSIEYFCRDYLIDPLDGAYDVVICIYCDFGALIPSDRDLLLERISQVLEEGGVFIFDVFKPGLSEIKKELRSWQYYPESSFWSETPHFLLEEIKHFPDVGAWGSRHIVMTDGQKPKEYITWDYYFTENDINSWLASRRYKVMTTNSDLVPKNDFTSSEVLFVVAKKL
jgi:SAM-dependent methyltransferase